MRLLTPANPKVTRGEASGYLTAVLHLAPAKLSGQEVCGSRTRGCSAVCLNSAGRGGIGATFDARGGLVVSNVIQRARIARTQFLFAAHEAFMSQLHGEIAAHIRKAQRLGLRPAVRLNGTSDLPVEQWGVIQAWKSVQFYDYTKHFNRMSQYLRGELPRNYHLTFSRAETLRSAADTMQVTEMGGNVAVVFGGKALPEAWNGLRVIDGTLTDLRFTDPHGVVVGLLAKGKAKRDMHSGFVVWL